MFSAIRRSNTTLIDKLYKTPHQFDFFQAVRLLDWIHYKKQDKQDGNLQFSVGYDRPQEKEIVRFRPIPSLQFPATQITRLIWQDLGANKTLPPEMMVTFMGLTGPSGVLPVHYTRELLNRFHDKDEILRDFLDLFNHRIISFYYRSWEKYRFYIHYERSRQRKKEDKFTKILRSFVGLGTQGLQKRLSFADDRILFYAGLFNSHSRNASSLAAILKDYLNAPITIQEFIRQKMRLPLSQRTRLPQQDKAGQYNELNKTAVLGGSVIQSQHRFRVVIGPLVYAQFKKFLPNKKALLALHDLVRLYVGEQYSFDVQLILKNDAYAGCYLFAKDQREHNQLGWNTWLGKPQKATLNDLILSF